MLSHSFRHSLNKHLLLGSRYCAPESKNKFTVKYHVRATGESGIFRKCKQHFTNKL